MSQTVNAGEDRLNFGIRILPLPSANGLFGEWMSGQRSGQFLVLRMGNYPLRPMSQKLPNGMKMWKGIGSTTIILFCLNGLNKQCAKKRCLLHKENKAENCQRKCVIQHFNEEWQGLEPIRYLLFYFTLDVVLTNSYQCLFQSIKIGWFTSYRWICEPVDWSTSDHGMLVGL